MAIYAARWSNMSDWMTNSDGLTFRRIMECSVHVANHWGYGWQCYLTVRHKRQELGKAPENVYFGGEHVTSKREKHEIENFCYMDGVKLPDLSELVLADMLGHRPDYHLTRPTVTMA